MSLALPVLDGLQSDREVVLVAVAQNGKALVHASAELMDGRPGGGLGGGGAKRPRPVLRVGRADGGPGARYLGTVLLDHHCVGSSVAPGPNHSQD